MRKTICAIIAVGCAITILSAAGESDLNKIGALEAFIRCVIALPVLVVSMMIGGFTE